MKSIKLNHTAEMALIEGPGRHNDRSSRVFQCPAIRQLRRGLAAKMAALPVFNARSSAHEPMADATCSPQNWGARGALSEGHSAEGHTAGCFSTRRSTAHLCVALFAAVTLCGCHHDSSTTTPTVTTGPAEIPNVQIADNADPWDITTTDPKAPSHPWLGNGYLGFTTGLFGTGDSAGPDVPKPLCLIAGNYKSDKLEVLPSPASVTPVVRWASSHTIRSNGGRPNRCCASDTACSDW